MKVFPVTWSTVASHAPPSIARGVATMAGWLVALRIDAWWFRQVKTFS